MKRWLVAMGVLAGFPMGSLGPKTQVAKVFEAVGTLEMLPKEYEAVSQVLAERAVDLSERERRAVARAICEEAEKAGYDPFLVLGMIDVESDFRPEVVSSADARGLMQIQPVTLGWLIMREQWPMSVEDVQKDPELQVRLGVRYVRYLHTRFKKLDAALMAYNMGPTKYGVVSLEPHGLDPYWGYAKAVRRDAAALKKRARVLEAGSMAIRNNSAKPLATADGLWGG